MLNKNFIAFYFARLLLLHKAECFVCGLKILALIFVPLHRLFFKKKKKLKGRTALELKGKQKIAFFRTEGEENKR